MEAYLDNSATTRCYDSVRDLVVKTMMEDYGNPSAMHMKGVEAERYVKEAAAKIASELKVSEKEILFTSGGTESDNLAIIGSVMANKRYGNHVITSAVEHAAVARPFDFLKSSGYDVTILPVDERGVVSAEDLKQALRPDTILVSVMYVNNEVGAVQPIDELAKVIHENNRRTVFHVDAIQGFGKFRIRPKKEGIDLLSVSGHKIHGPKGVGFLYISDKVKVIPQILGGGQQGGMRSGTDNVPGISGLGEAVQRVYKDFDKKQEQMRRLKILLAEELTKLDGVAINGMSPKEGAPHILNLSFVGIRSEVLLHALEERGVFVSAGSACSTHKRKPSATLTAMGLNSDRIESAIRMSLSEETTEEEVRYAIEQITALVPMLKKYARK